MTGPRPPVEFHRPDDERAGQPRRHPNAVRRVLDLRTPPTATTGEGPWVLAEVLQSFLLAYADRLGARPPGEGA